MIHQMLPSRCCGSLGLLTSHCYLLVLVREFLGQLFPFLADCVHECCDSPILASLLCQSDRLGRFWHPTVQPETSRWLQAGCCGKSKRVWLGFRCFRYSEPVYVSCRGSVAWEPSTLRLLEHFDSRLSGLRKQPRFGWLRLFPWPGLSF